MPPDWQPRAPFFGTATRSLAAAAPQFEGSTAPALDGWPDTVVEPPSHDTIQGATSGAIRLTPVLTTCTSFSNSGLSGIFTVFTYEIGFRGLRQTRYTSLPAFL